MSYRDDPFAPGEIYHVYTRGVEKRKIFRSEKDRLRFIQLMLHYLPRSQNVSYSVALKIKLNPQLTPTGTGLVDILCYCLMNNHVHLLIRENAPNGISTYMRQVLTAYAKFFNINTKRSGSLFLHPFKSVLVDDDDYLLHLSRYIHLNPYVAHLIEEPFTYQWSSLNDYIEEKKSQYCHTDFLRNLISVQEYKKFIENEAEYARSLADLKHLLLDNEDD